MDFNSKNTRKICFIMCANNERYLEEAAYYIGKLNIPAGYETEFLSVSGARSMTSGYNEAMRSTDAKYKVYMHQDVMIVEKDFLYQLLRIFEDAQVGMAGMVGALKLPPNGMLIYSQNRVGRIFSWSIDCAREYGFNPIDRDTEVEAVDGLLMATQYDLPWREDLFDGWDFYDVSQSFEFRKAGYKIVVPYMERPWVVHDDGFMDLHSYIDYRKRFVKEYLRS